MHNLFIMVIIALDLRYNLQLAKLGHFLVVSPKATKTSRPALRLVYIKAITNNKHYPNSSLESPIDESVCVEELMCCHTSKIPYFIYTHHHPSNIHCELRKQTTNAYVSFRQNVNEFWIGGLKV